MIKKKVLENIIIERSIPILSRSLVELGFKYFKSKKIFRKTENDVEFHIKINTQQSRLEYEEQIEEPRINFSIIGFVYYPKFNDWHEKTLGEPSRMNEGTESYSAYVVPEIEDFTEASIYTPTKSQIFKSNVLNSLRRPSKELDLPLEVSVFAEIKLPQLINSLIEKSDPKRLFDKREFPLQYTFFMHYHGYEEIAKVQINKSYQYFLDKIEEEENSKRYIQRFEKFISDVRIITGIDLPNPYSQLIELLPNQEQLRLNFKPIAPFKEILRFNIRNADLGQLAISSEGYILLYINNSKILLVDPKGTVRKDIEIPIQAGFNKLNWEIPLGFEEQRNIAFANNLVIVENQTIVLEIPRQSKKSKIKQASNLKDLVIIDDFIFTAYQNFLLKYSFEGILLETIELKFRITKIIKSKKWLICTNIICDFSGNMIQEFKVGHANSKHTLSKSKDAIVFYGYSTKSQYYEFNGKQKTLWAHPTFKKGYKEELYSDIHHNFDLSNLCFSPDDNLMVGAGHHGKYVAWTRKNFKRHELIPKAGVIDVLKPFRKSVREGDKFITAEIKPVVVDLNGELFLKNRGNGARSIQFIEDGKFFILELPNLITLWDSNSLKNIFYEKIDGIIDFNGEKYFSERNKDELIIYKKSYGH